ncbi:Hypothetical protein PHPALM_36630 [Phytophthora palmivora]|uniref:Uncharacterized protein n=1 Tax=Phytophthora palmivora TaxID=4796 RepID=A0A2P4WZG7_9STRA|nr:Hypothetical protein PHPALM_36630 [Phytophthora palmivora]
MARLIDYVKGLMIGIEETAFSGVSYSVVNIIARRKKNGDEQFLMLLDTCETSWRPRATLLPTCSVLIKAFEDAQRKELGLPELRKSSRLANANVAVDEDEILF